MKNVYTLMAPRPGGKFLSIFGLGAACGFLFTYLLLTAIVFKEEKLESSVTISESFTIGSHRKNEEFHKDEDMIAREITKQVRILCWVMTHPDNHESKAKHVKATWGKRCNILIFFSQKDDTSLPAISIGLSGGREILWGKTKRAFTYVYHHYLDSVDWVLKADDDTYVIVENLRYLLSNYSPSDPLYFGCRFKPFVKQGFMSGGAGYVLSKEAVKRLVENGLLNPHRCRQGNDGLEDVEIGICLENVNVTAMDSRDSLGRGRFLPLNPEEHLTSHLPADHWYWSHIYYPAEEGIGCCSDTAISFHYVSPNKMYVMEYLLYHLRPYGVSPFFKPLRNMNLGGNDTAQGKKD